jgi:hypothetical protein
MGRQPKGRSLCPGIVKNFLFSTSSRPALGCNQHPTQWVPGALSSEVKGPGREADYSPPTSIEITYFVSQLFTRGKYTLYKVAYMTIKYLNINIVFKHLYSFYTQYIQSTMQLFPLSLLLTTCFGGKRPSWEWFVLLAEYIVYDIWFLLFRRHKTLGLNLN